MSEAKTSLSIPEVSEAHWQLFVYLSSSSKLCLLRVLKTTASPPVVKN
jgi:hypothetical protein